MNITRMLVSVFTLAALLGPVSQTQAWSLWGGGDEPRHERDRDLRDRDRGHRDWEWFYSRHYYPIGHELRELPRDVLRVILGGVEYYYCEGLFYRAAADHYVVVQAPVGAVVTTVPAECRPVIIEGTPYYLINGTTYVSTSAGYQVVPPPNAVVVQPPPPDAAAPVPVTMAPVPVAASAPAPVAPPVTAAPPPPASATPVAADNVFTVNIPNSKGTYTTVTLTRSGNGFVGPQGEFYTEFPRVEQLKVMYGK